MSEPPERQRFLPRKKVAQFGGRRGSLYAWVRTHYPAIQVLRATHTDIWAILSVEAVEDGAAREVPSKNLRKYLWHAWRRVVRDIKAESVEKERLARARAEAVPGAASRPTYPSRFPADWRPETVVPPPPPQWQARSSGMAGAGGPPPPTAQPPSRSIGPPMPAPDPRAPATPAVPTITLRPLINGLPPLDETPEEKRQRGRETIARAMAAMEAEDRRKYDWPA